MNILEIELTPSIERKLDEGAKQSGFILREHGRTTPNKRWMMGDENDADEDARRIGVWRYQLTG